MKKDIPPEVLDLLIFMCNTWDVIDQFVYEHLAQEDAIEHYPVIQGTANQMALRRIGKLPYDKANLGKAVQWMKNYNDSSKDVQS